ncbi:NAD-dependent protein deacylase [Allofournierella sp.]|mgnify:FL=1|uniref:NAD-dependent protein deacylase n=1 Tax=Allofournierella sp. TaxID=1940256 RepID=UPI002E7A651D|nr:NAD-dependent protein deacylase [Fournierella sp.]MEE0755899.1 NAD-dependent protein deacylase [Fournierella sp.]
MDEQLQQLSQMIGRARRMAFLGGAGLSTESGIPDFRSSNGVYAALKAYGRPPEELLSHGFFVRHPDVFFDYYRKYLIRPEAKPNPAHYALARLEQQGKLTAVVTQNIDELHQRAGSRNVLELHGSVYRNHCMECGKSWPVEAVLEADGVPRCTCGGVIKPDVVLYGEGLDSATLTAAVEAIAAADMLLIGGTQLSVYPAAGLVDYFHGKDLAVINLSATPRDAQAALTIRRPIGEVLAEVVP